MKKVTKSFILNSSPISITLNPITNNLVIYQKDDVILKRLLWKPIQTFHFKSAGKHYRLRVSLFPLNSVKLFDKEACIDNDVFPRYRALSLISFAIGILKRLVLTVGHWFS